MIRYMINGWEESISYVKSLGITEDEIQLMMTGETVHKNGNDFYIIVD